MYIGLEGQWVNVTEYIITHTHMLKYEHGTECCKHMSLRANVCTLVPAMISTSWLHILPSHFLPVAGENEPRGYTAIYTLQMLFKEIILLSANIKVMLCAHHHKVNQTVVKSKPTNIKAPSVTCTVRKRAKDKNLRVIINPLHSLTMLCPPLVVAWGTACSEECHIRLPTHHCRISPGWRSDTSNTVILSTVSHTFTHIHEDCTHEAIKKLLLSWHLLGVVPVPLVITDTNHVWNVDSNRLYLVHKDIPLREKSNVIKGSFTAQ